jgi:hypothetical protein
MTLGSRVALGDDRREAQTAHPEIAPLIAPLSIALVQELEQTGQGD